jgi:hypothetical protein
MFEPSRDESGGGEKERAPTSCLAGAEVHTLWLDGQGDEGVRVPIQLVCIDNARVARRFPHKQERARDGRRCPY